MAKPQQTSTRKDPPAPAHAPTVIDIQPSPEAGTALSLRQQGAALVVVDRAGHQNALEFIRGAKQVRRAIVEHWSRIKRNVDTLKKNLLDLERRDLDPVDAAIASAETVSLEYESQERARAQAEQDRIRREAEQRAATERAEQLALQEERALKLEAESSNLSAREQTFVELMVMGGVNREDAARRAGYKEPATQAKRLLETKKIIGAIEAKRAAFELRQQAAALKKQPLDVVTQKVAPDLGKVAGVSSRVYYSANLVDPKKLLGVLIARGEFEALEIREPYLNDKAKQLTDAFEAAYPGALLVKRSGIAG